MEERIKSEVLIAMKTARDNAEALTDGSVEDITQAILTAVAESQVNRFEVIDHTGEGRVFTKWVEEPFNVKLSHQDDGRTLKVFLAQLGKEGR